VTLEKVADASEHNDLFVKRSWSQVAPSKSASMDIPAKEVTATHAVDPSWSAAEYSRSRTERSHEKLVDGAFQGSIILFLMAQRTIKARFDEPIFFAINPR
jgi:hypothetical protein